MARAVDGPVHCSTIVCVLLPQKATHSATRVICEPLLLNSAMLLITDAAAGASKHRHVMLRGGRLPARRRPKRPGLTCNQAERRQEQQLNGSKQAAAAAAAKTVAFQACAMPDSHCIQHTGAILRLSRYQLEMWWGHHQSWLQATQYSRCGVSSAISSRAQIRRKVQAASDSGS